MTTIKKSTPQTNQPTVSKASTQVEIKASSAIAPKKVGRPKGSKNKTQQEPLTSQLSGADESLRKSSVNLVTSVKGTNSNRYEEAKNGQFALTTVSQVLGEDVRDKFGTAEEEEYHRKICNMSRREIFYHASQLGVPLNESLLRLRKNLLAEFRKHLSNFKVPKGAGSVIGTVPKQSNQLNRKIQTIQEFKDAPDEIQEILDEVK